jgi:hypothetical protein
MNIDPSNIVKNLETLGYKAKFVSGNNKETGKPYNLIDVHTGSGRISASLKFSDSSAVFQCWSNFEEGHNGLEGDALKAHNSKLAAMTRAKLEAPVMAAYVAELAGLDVAMLDGGFRLSGRKLWAKPEDGAEENLEGVPAVPSQKAAAPAFKR